MLSPRPHWCLSASLSSPEGDVEGKGCQHGKALWAPDDSAVLLHYLIRDSYDARARFCEESYFDVRAQDARLQRLLIGLPSMSGISRLNQSHHSGVLLHEIPP